MINKVILIGNVGQDPEIRYTGDATNGAKVATIRLATTERFRDRSGNLQEHTEWHSVVVWRNTVCGPTQFKPVLFKGQLYSF